MQETNEKFLSDEFLAAMELNMIAFFSSYGRAKGSAMISTSNVFWFYTGIQTPLFNGLLAVRLNEDEVKATIDTLQARIDEKGAPALWWIGPLSKPDNITFLLEKSGLQHDGEVPAMVCDLNTMDHELDILPNFTVRKVHTGELQTQWARTAGIGFGFLDNVTDELVNLETTLTDQHYRSQHRYIGYLNDLPVATSALVLESGLAGIYAVATIPSVRRKGIGRIMTLIPLIEAKQNGFQIGILQASAMGYSIYSKIGFKEIYKYNLFLQSKKE